jgi:tetratricopeptide (TPR) repeat protein
MKHSGKLASLTVLAAVLLASPLFAGDKMPITTTSEKAMEYFLQGRDLQDKLRLPDSKPYLESAVAEDPEFALAYLSLAFAQSATKDFFRILDQAKATMHHASESEQMQIRAAVAASTGDPSTQFDLLAELAKKYPDDLRARTPLGNAYFGRQEFDKAILEYEAVLRVAPEFSPVYNQLGYSYRFQQKYDDAERTFRKYIELIPNDPNPYDSYAELLLKIGRYEDAIKQYRKALSVQNTFAASYGGIATCYNHLGLHDQARTVAQELMVNAINDGQRRTALFFKAVSYVDEGNIEGAISEVQKEFKVAEQLKDPTSMSNDLALIGRLLLEAGKPDLALEQFERGLAFVESSDLSEPTKANNRQGFKYNAGTVAVRKGDIETAKRHHAQFYEAANEKQNRFQLWLSHELAGLIAMETQDYKAAIGEFEQANPQNMYNIYRMAVASEKLGDYDRARELCTQVTTYNQLSNINYVIVRQKAQRMLDAM